MENLRKLFAKKDKEIIIPPLPKIEEALLRQAFTLEEVLLNQLAAIQVAKEHIRRCKV